MDKVTDIFFDLDHTLWDFEKNSALTFHKILSESNVNVDSDLFIKTYVPINLKYWRMFREERISKRDLRYSRLAETFSQLQIPVKDSLINHLSEAYITHLSSFNHLFEHTHDLLSYLQEKYRLHIITNGFRGVQQKKLEGSGIADYFEHVIDSESVMVKKPNPKIFQFALNITHTQPQQALMIGDSLEADIEGALAMQMLAIHVDFDKSATHDLCPIVHNLAAIKNLL